MIDVSIDAERSIRTVTLDRPAARNALTVDGLEALERALGGDGGDGGGDGDSDGDDESEDEVAESVVYLQGRGPAFCAGADLEAVGSLEGNREAGASFVRRGQRVARTIADAPAVVVAGIDGAARGGGLELAMACDVRVGTPDSTYGEPGVTFGLFGAWGGTVRLPRLVGEGHALEFALSGRTVDADEALRMGLISRIEDDPRRVAETIAANPDDTLTALKRRLRDDRGRATQERLEAEAFGDLVAAHAEEIDGVLE